MKSDTTSHLGFDSEPHLFSHLDCTPDLSLLPQSIDTRTAQTQSVLAGLAPLLFLIDKLSQGQWNPEQAGKDPHTWMGCESPEKRKYVQLLPPHTVRPASDSAPCQLTCGECKKHAVTCGGVWRFYSQHGKYLMQCRTCRAKRRSCPFRLFECEDTPQTSPRKKYGTGGKKRRRSPSIISVTDSAESSEELGHQVAGPSRVSKKVKVGGGNEWDRLKETLLTARKRKVEIETEAEMELARVNNIIEEAERSLKKVK